MNWDSRDPNVFEGDLNKLLSYNSRSIRVARVLKIGTRNFSYTSTEEDENVKDEPRLRRWLNEISSQYSTAKGVYVLFGGRAPASASGQAPNPQSLLNIPLSRETFRTLTYYFWTNISIVRAINRGEATFSRTHFIHEATKLPLISYNIRSSNSEEKDLAMSVTADVDNGLTYVIVYGCERTDTESFLAKLKHSGGAYQHPMLLPGLFVEIQRLKHVRKVEDSVDALLEHVINLGKSTPIINPAVDEEDQDDEPKEFVDLWLDVCHIKSILETWHMQVGKMIEHIDELREIAYGRAPDSGGRPDMVAEGIRIKERLLDIIAEYEKLQRECSWVIEGATLANDMAWNHLARLDNKIQTDLAVSAKLDSGQMRSIALLTMVFLPGTFVASFFAMPLFNWDADASKGEKIYSHHFWIYWVVTACLTLGTVVVWVRFSRQEKRKYVYDESKGGRSEEGGILRSLRESLKKRRDRRRIPFCVCDKV